MSAPRRPLRPPPVAPPLSPPLWRRHPWLAGGLAVSGLLALVFALRLAGLLAWWADPERGNQPVADWMTPRYIQRVYGLDPDALSALLGLPPHGAPREPLSAIARSRGEDAQDLVARIQAAVEAADTPAGAAP